MTIFFKRKLKNFLTLSILGIALFVSDSFAKSEPTPCDLIQNVYNVCAKTSEKELKNVSLSERRKNCSFVSMSIALDMYNTLSKNPSDKKFAKNVSILLGLICKDGCLGTDDFYSESKEKLCK